MRKMLMVGVIGLATVAAPSVQADMLRDVTSVVTSLASQGPAYACKKANLFGGTFTLRSFSGTLCSNALIAAFTQKVCPGVVSDFVNSGCDTIGKKTLGTQDPMTVLKGQISTAPAPIKSLLCKVSSLAPDATLKATLSAACAA